MKSDADQWRDIRLPRAEWDAEARAVYLRLLPWAGPLTQDEGGGVIVDRAPLDDNIVVGIEMIGAPIGADSLHVSAKAWVLAGRAWERCSEAMRLNPKGAGAFTIGAGQDTPPAEEGGS